MAPEFPVDLSVLDLRFENGELVGSVHHVERGDNERLQRLHVTWNATAAPDGFFPVAGGAVYVANTPKSFLPPSYDVKPDALGNDRYWWPFDRGTDQMMVLVFPRGYVPRDCKPRPESARAFDGRIVAYWKAGGIEWTLKPLQSNVAKEVIRLNREAARIPGRRIAGIDIIDTPAGKRDNDLLTVMLGVVTLAFLMFLIFYGPRDLPSDYKPLVRLIAALTSGLLAGLFTG